MSCSAPPAADRGSRPALAAMDFRAIGTANRIVATELSALPDAVTLAQRHLADLDAAVSRFRDDSEVSRLAAAAAQEPAGMRVSAMFVDYLLAGLRAARLTDGLVDPTVGSAVVAAGYDADLDVVRRRGLFIGADTAAVPGWQHIEVDPDTGQVNTPAGCLIDLGATAKAYAADRIAVLLGERLPGGFLVSLGGDIATAGTLPPDGWQIGVEGADGSILQLVSSTGQAFATSSTRLRTWTGVDGPRHHILDPRTGRPAVTRWAQVSCAAASALEANAASTAAVILDDAAPGWLTERGIPARLDALDGTVTTTPGWPAVTAGDQA